MVISPASLGDEQQKQQHSNCVQQPPEMYTTPSTAMTVYLLESESQYELER